MSDISANFAFSVDVPTKKTLAPVFASNISFIGIEFWEMTVLNNLDFLVAYIVPKVVSVALTLEICDHTRDFGFWSS